MLHAKTTYINISLKLDAINSSNIKYKDIFFVKSKKKNSLENNKFCDLGSCIKSVACDIVKVKFKIFKIFLKVIYLRKLIKLL